MPEPTDLDAHQTAKPGEPTFTLQGGDPFAPLLVLGWARMARKKGLLMDSQERAKGWLLKASSAEEVAWAMQQYQKGWPEHVAETSTIRGEVVERKLDVAAARRKLVDALTSSVGNIAEAVNKLQVFEPGPEFDVAFGQILEAQACLNAAASIFHVRAAGEPTGPLS